MRFSPPCDPALASSADGSRHADPGLEQRRAMEERHRFSRNLDRLDAPTPACTVVAAPWTSPRATGKHARSAGHAQVTSVPRKIASPANSAPICALPLWVMCLTPSSEARVAQG